MFFLPSFDKSLRSFHYAEVVLLYFFFLRLPKKKVSFSDVMGSVKNLVTGMNQLKQSIESSRLQETSGSVLKGDRFLITMEVSDHEDVTSHRDWSERDT